MLARVKQIAPGFVLVAIALLLVSGPVRATSRASTGGSAPVRAAMPALMPGPVTIEICASAGTVDLPSAPGVPIWGFSMWKSGTASCDLAQLPGPILEVVAGDVVTITLHNMLSENVALSFPGQDVVPDTTGASPSGGTAAYTFTADDPGTYLYEAGLNTDVQLPMGLYGALIVRPTTPLQAYDDASTAYDIKSILVLSEFDLDPAADDGPEYWLINGKAYPDTGNVMAPPDKRLLLRYLNAGSDHYTMALLGLHQRVIAKDAYQAPFAYDVVGETIPAGSTADMIVTIPLGAALGTKFPLYNRQLHLTNAGASPGGMMTFIEVGTPPANTAPSVEAGADQTIILPNTAALDGTVSDDGLPSATLVMTWTVDSGPGTVTFGDASAEDTTASFSADGTYVLRLTADDTELTASDVVTITVNPIPTNTPPSVEAGDDQTITLPDDTADLDGTVSDDGLPSATLIMTWTVDSGPGTATFSDANTEDPTATFSADGIYVLRLTADDTTLTASDVVTITVNPTPTNMPPSVDAGPDQTITLPDDTADLDGTVSDDGLPSATLIMTWTVDSGPGLGTVTFGNANAVDTTAAFSADGTYVLRLTADDTELTTSDMVTITVNPAPMHIGDLDNTSTNQGANWRARARVTVHNSSEGAVGGATVTGTWTFGASSATASCVTGTDGVCQAQVTGIPDSVPNATFTVTSVTNAGFSYNAAANHDPDGDSNGTTITVSQP